MRKQQLKECAAQLLFAANLRQIRLAKRMTQEEVAERADLHTNYISSVERGQRNLSIGNIERIAHALDVPMPVLLNEPSAVRAQFPMADD